jgi:DNA-binding NarL/FixJ family response regulator
VAKARVLVVDDHPIVRLGICQMVRTDPDLSVCGEAETPDKALELATHTHPDLAIVDLSLREGSGLELVRALRASLPDLPVLVLSMHDEALFAERVLRAGARGYIMKQEAISGLIEAIRRVLAGRIYVSERMAQSVLERVRRADPDAGGWLNRLTDREIEVFQRIGRGLGTAAIAKELGVSIKTIETYRANIKTKLELRDAAELIRYAVSWNEER